MITAKDLAKFPTSPGVYLMKDKQGKILYVGKAKNLRSRVRQYFLGGDGRPQIPYLMSRVESVDTVIVSSEKEALLLENTLIKRHKPRYNVFLRDDKSYISIAITHHKWPMIRLVRYKGKPKADADYFGPYTSALAARETFEFLTRHFPLRRCSDTELVSRVRPCILYQIRRCIAPCVGLCTEADYQKVVTRVSEVLRGRDQEVIADLKSEIDAASLALEFEQAQTLLQTLHSLERTVEQQQVDQAGREDRDVFAIYREGDELVLSQLCFREGKLIGAQNYSFSSIAQDDAELLSSFLLQHYQEEPEVPHEIVVPAEPEDSETLSLLISEGKRRRAHIIVPKKGDKRALLEMAQANAASAFVRGKDEARLREKRLLALEERLQLVNYPRRIECFDNSALAGSEPVAAMVTFIDGEKDTSRYRKYRLREASGSDDYGAMREVLTRRLKKGQEEDDLPDLIVVDGGKGQLGVAEAVLADLNIVTVDLVAIAKEEGRHDKGLTSERLFRPGQAAAVVLPHNSDELFLMQQIRDEAHRFALSFQTKRRSKQTMRSQLDEIPGIGPTKRTRLLRHFGSVKRIKEATDDELAAIKGITKRDIEQLRNKLI